MRIKTIEMTGFKSFADRQRVQLDDRITGVIGPNGCGKSNIVDAMRWCLGEQRAKHLRGSGMADVIFSGSSTRKGAASAEVTVTFENDGRVPAAYLSFSEIAISRRLFRDGSSQYLINGVACRLRDINTMLLGTGVGARGYSIIEQGRVSDLVVSKPEDRRAIIDEAAGITKFKLQKNTAKKRIDQTEQNLMRINDILGELGKRRQTLQKAAEKAEAFVALQSQLRDLDLWIASHQYLKWSTRRRKLRVVCADRDAQVQRLEAGVSEQEAQIEVAKAKRKACESELAAAQEELHALLRRQELAQQDREFRSQAQAARQERLESLESQREGGAARLEELKSEVQRAQESFERTQQALEEAQGAEGVDALDEEHGELVQRSSTLQRELARAEQERQECRTQVASLEARLQSLEESTQQEKQRHEALQGELRELQDDPALSDERLAQAQKALEAATQGQESLQQKRATQDKQRETLREQLRATQKEYSNAQSHELERRSKLDSLEEIQKRYRGCNSGVQVLVAQKEKLSGLSGIAADYLSSVAKYDAAITAALGDRLQALVVSEPAVGQRGIELLRETQEGRSAFLPLQKGPNVELVEPNVKLDKSDKGESPLAQGECLVDAVQIKEGAPPALRACLARFWWVDSLATALGIWSEAAAAGYDLVTEDGVLLEASGCIWGGSAESLHSALLEQKREIEELRTQVEQAQSQSALATSKLRGVQQELEELERARALFEQEQVEAQAQLFTARQALHRIQEGRAQQSKARLRLEEEIQGLAEKLSQREDEQNNRRESLVGTQEKIPALDEGIASLQENIERLRVQREELASQLTQAKVQRARLVEQHSAQRQTLERQQAALERETRQHEEMHQQLGTLQEEIEAESGAIKQSDEELLACEQQLGTSQKAKDEGEQALREAKAAADILEQQSRDDRQRFAEVQKQAADAHLEFAEVENKLDAVLSSVQDRYDEDLRLHVLAHHDRPLADEEQKALAKSLRRKVAGMGDVNLTAIDEYREVLERFEYLEGQANDLSDAIAQLQAAIDKIDETTRIRFEATFAAVNEKFKAIFPRLFAGGQAQLVLTDPKDVLATGVDIEAQPPGKKVSRLELMSGGEKALTAVSLIFGIFLIKPSPFCLLDEVDAPLDEANVGRFCDLVRELSEDTQFIIITHNKRTMEAADRLYGVTMQQRGVSKLVSVNITHAAQKAEYAESSVSSSI